MISLEKIKSQAAWLEKWIEVYRYTTADESDWDMLDGILETLAELDEFVEIGDDYDKDPPF